VQHDRAFGDALSHVDVAHEFSGFAKRRPTNVTPLESGRRRRARATHPPGANPFRPYSHGGHEAASRNDLVLLAPFDHYLPKSFRIEGKLYSRVIASNE
jgi:hypothetical protein